MATVCIFTPTYNRAYTLTRLYNSLVSQTCDDFSWLVVDDGSTDNTESLIQSFIAEGKIEIRYKKTENGGKQRAMNVGVELCADELFFCVDSDDYLVSEAVAVIVNEWVDVRGDVTCAGLIALRGSDERTPLHGFIPDGISRTTIWDLYNKTPFAGDTSLVHRTSILRCYPYDVDYREKFISESTVYYAIDQMFTLKAVNKVLTICKYLEDGYTKNVRKLTKDNPIGYIRHHKSCMQMSETPYKRWYHLTLWIVGCYLAEKKYGKECDGLEWPGKTALSLLAYPAAWLLLVTEFK